VNWQKYFCIIATNFALFISGISAQDSQTFVVHRHKIGFVVGYGGQQFLNVPYDYKVYFLQAQYYYSFAKKQNITSQVRNNPFTFEILLQPQLNFTDYRPVNDIDARNQGFEYGLNVEILVRRNLINDNLGIYIYLGTGPHYVSGTPRRQSPGFIFSDNLFMGVYFKLDDNLYLDIRPGFRHISNAGIKNPNGGVNTGILSGGIFWTL
jgi:hypothetical protein